ncbi:MAG TPA: hypothetical protein VGL61_03535 [Kofleriaceae bacterium]|jgi:hypothetical protein
MTITHLRFAKSTTRDLADRSRVGPLSLRLGEPEAWHQNNTWFFFAFVAVAGALALLALALR